MPYATNAVDGTRIYFEDDGGRDAGRALRRDPRFGQARAAGADPARAGGVAGRVSADLQDTDFFEQARRAAEETPTAEFVSLEELDHLGAHFLAERVLPAVLRTLRDNS